MQLYSIASGSSGNCIYISDGSTRILIDAGISYKKIEAALKANSIMPEDIQAVFITHEHSDHICGLGVLLRKLHIPAYATYETLEYIKGCKSIGKIDEGLLRPVFANTDMQFNGFTIHPFSIPHDAVNPVAYRITSSVVNKCPCTEKGTAEDTVTVAVATDIGYFNDYIIENLKDLDAILIEANHDVHMLLAGSYPYLLKQRILSEKGHLSNENSGRLLTKIISDKMKYILLGHLSRENNYEELAYETVRLEIEENGKKSINIPIMVAKRDYPTEMITI